MIKGDCFSWVIKEGFSEMTPEHINDKKEPAMRRCWAWVLLLPGSTELGEPEDRRPMRGRRVLEWITESEVRYCRSLGLGKETMLFVQHADLM